jgi:hypothetical protein
MRKDSVDHVLNDGFNYHYADWAIKKHVRQWVMDNEFFYQKGEKPRGGFDVAGGSLTEDILRASDTSPNESPQYDILIFIGKFLPEINKPMGL